MPDAQVSPVFNIGASDEAGAKQSNMSRMSRSAGRMRSKPRTGASGTRGTSANAGGAEELEAGVRNLGIDPTNAAPPQPPPQPSNIPPPPPVAGAASGATASAWDLEDAVKTANGACSFTIGAEDPSGSAKTPRSRRAKVNVGANRATAPTEPVEPPSQPDVPMSARSAWPNGGTSSEGPPTARPTTAPAAPQQPAPPAVSRSKSGVPDQPEGDVDPSWRAAEEQKERGNRRYAIKSWGEAHACYRKALDELTKHPKHGTNSPEGRALATKAASYHANSAAALMQLGKLPEALAECDAALNADRTPVSYTHLTLPTKA